jgi:DNA-directed RNA polymerase specialized sigma24 family protein
LEHRRGRRWRTVWQKLACFWQTTSNHHTDFGGGPDEQRRIVAEVLNTLDPDLRSELVLRYFNELTSAEIGQILGWPDSTVRSHLRKARRQLAAVLKQAGYDDEDKL